MANEKVVSKDGVTYEITAEGKVKKVKSLRDLPKVVDVEAMNSSQQLKVIYAFLKDKDDTTVLKNKSIHCRGYRMGFTEMGFTIYDGMNFGKKLDFDSPMPTPREVWEAISKINTEDSSYVHKMANALLDKKRSDRDRLINAKATSKIILEKREEEKEAQRRNEIVKKQEVTIEQLNEKRVKLIKMLKASKKVNNVIEKMKGAMPHRGFTVLYNKIYRRYKDGEMRAPMFIKEVIHLLTTIDFTPKKERAPLYVPVEFKTKELELVDNTTVNIVNGKGSIQTMSVTEVLCRFYMVDERHMAPVMKLLRGEITPNQFLACPAEKDIYVEFDVKLIKKNNPEVNEAILRVLKNSGMFTPFSLHYINTLPKKLEVGYDILIQLKDSCSEVKAKVISIDDGIEVRYEDGSVHYLLNHQEYAIV